MKLSLQSLVATAFMQSSTGLTNSIQGIKAIITHGRNARNTKLHFNCILRHKWTAETPAIFFYTNCLSKYTVITHIDTCYQCPGNLKGRQTQEATIRVVFIFSHEEQGGELKSGGEIQSYQWLNPWICLLIWETTVSTVRLTINNYSARIL